MALKPTIQIQVDDSAFQKFQDDVKKLRGMIGQPLPANAFKNVIDSLNDFSNKMKKVKQDVENVATQGLGSRVKSALTDALEPAKKLGDAFKSIASSVEKTTMFMLRWTGIAGVFGTLLGGLGITSLARSASTGRTTSSGLGVSQGELTAFRLNYERYGLGDDTLRNIAANQKDLSSDTYRGLRRLGFSDAEIQNGDPAQLAAEAVLRAKRAYQATGGSPQLLDPSGVTSVFSLEQMRRFANTPDEELRKQQQTFSSNSKTLDIDGGVEKRYQDFLQFLDTAGNSIKKTFIEGLAGLTGPLSLLATAVAEDIKAFFGNDAVKEALTQIAEGLKHFAVWIGSEDFKADIAAFVGGMKSFVEALKWATEKIAYWFPASGVVAPSNGVALMPGDANVHRDIINGAGSGLTGNDLSHNIGKSLGGYFQNQRYRTAFSEIEKQYKLPSGILWGTYGAESSFGKDPNTSSAGARGPFQFMPETGKKYGLVTDADFDDPLKSAQAAGKYYADLLKKFNGDARKAIAAYNVGEGAVDADVFKADSYNQSHGFFDKKTWEDFLPKETQGQLQKVAPYIFNPGTVVPMSARDTNIKITLDNRTGNNAILSVQQLAIPT